MKVWQWRIAPMTSQADLVLDNTLAGPLTVLSKVFLVWSTSRSFRQHFMCSMHVWNHIQQCKATQDPMRWQQAPYRSYGGKGKSCKVDYLELKDWIFSLKNRPKTSWCKLLLVEKGVDEAGSWPHTTGNSAGSPTWMDLGDLMTIQSYAEPWSGNLNPASSKGQMRSTSKAEDLSLSFQVVEMSSLT